MTAFAKVLQRINGESNDAFAERLAAAVQEDSAESDSEISGFYDPEGQLSPMKSTQ